MTHAIELYVSVFLRWFGIKQGYIFSKIRPVGYGLGGKRENRMRGIWRKRGNNKDFSYFSPKMSLIVHIFHQYSGMFIKYEGFFCMYIWGIMNFKEYIFPLYMFPLYRL